MATLVTGATGFIGSRLLQRGDLALVRTGIQARGAKVGNILDPVSLSVACEGVDTIFHCAGYAHTFSGTDPNAHWRINYEGTCNLLRAAGESGVKRFVFLSSVKAMGDPGQFCADENWPGDPVTPYGRAKRAAEESVLEAGSKFGMHVVNLRLAMVYGRAGRGNLERMARAIRSGWFLPISETGNRRSLVHVDDVVMVMRMVAQRREANGGTYIVADPRQYSVREIYDSIRIALRKPAIGWAVPAELLRLSGRMGDLMGAVLRRPLPINSDAMSRLLDSACYSPAKIERELGWRARVDLIQGMREMLTDEADN
jgi:UDP-glucose 4-epimerase